MQAREGTASFCDKEIERAKSGMLGCDELGQLENFRALYEKDVGADTMDRHHLREALEACLRNKTKK